MGLAEIRSAFLGYFRARDHVELPSGPIAPRGDPTLMFANSGMVQFKDAFTGVSSPPSPPRATTSQKCLRAGGKHNDLDNVGYTSRHHTFFEMLGNFSFGDYFKEGAIEHAWRLATSEFGLPSARLWATVHSSDEEAFSLWRSISGLPESRIVRIPTDDNFWSMGSVGPCGPCSELFYDHGDEVSGGPPGSPDEDGDRFVEIWNLVFMQYERDSEGELSPLPHPSIDTGMGLERISAALQGVSDNYENDLFRSLIGSVASLTPRASPDDLVFRPSYRVVADHLRACCFLLSGGVTPSNEGVGYVLRRILRRGMRHARILGVDEPLLCRLAPSLTELMGEAYPELVSSLPVIESSLLSEERSFGETLERGLWVLEKESSSLSRGDVLSGSAAFRLYDTYGFPLDLTADALKPRGISVDEEGFASAMESQRRRARASWRGGREGADLLAMSRLGGVTEDLSHGSASSVDGRVTSLFREGVSVERLSEGDEGVVVADCSPFYGEGGGQVGDRGEIRGDSFRLEVSDVRRGGDALLHFCRVSSGVVSAGASATLLRDEDSRRRTSRHHSATHLLHECLRRVLGDHVEQRGSLVSWDRLRFDFSHPQPVSSDELERASSLASSVISSGGSVSVRTTSLDEAIGSGARALFGEKYGDDVRVVSMGFDSASPSSCFSSELCGGTHVSDVSEIFAVEIISETGVSSGVRRIEALAGESLLDHLRSSVASERARADGALSSLRTREKELSSTRDRLASLESRIPSDGFSSSHEDVFGVSFAGRILSGASPRQLRGVTDSLLSELKSGVAATASSHEGKGSVAVGVTSDLTSRIDAACLVRAGSAALGGSGGGGRRDFAQGGGPRSERLEEAIEAIRSSLRSSLSD